MKRIYSIFIVFIMFIYSQLTFAQNTYDTQKFINSMDVGRYNVLANHNNDSFYCIKNTCTIKFNKTFKTVPVVFLMNTVNFNDEQDQPSALIIKEVTTSSVTFKQVMAPDKAKPDGVVPKPMKLINYLAVEKGAYKLPDDSYVIANSRSTNYFQYKFKAPKGTENYNKWENVNLNKYINGNEIKLSNIPGVLHQKQTDNNHMWLTTTVKDVTKNKFKISLEKSEIDGEDDKANNNIKIPEKKEMIGFLAGSGHFTYENLRMLFGIQHTTSTLSTQDPITSGCANYVDFKPQFNSIPYIFANKDARSGPDGGWVRLCQALNNKASFAIDEDMDNDPNRDHQGEVIGYVAIDYKKEEPPINELCKYFPSTVSSNDANGKIVLSENSTIYGEYKGFTLNFYSINHQGHGREDNCRYKNERPWTCKLTNNYNPVPILDVNIPDNGDVDFGSGSLKPGSYGDYFLWSGTLYLKSGNYFFNSLILYGNVKLLTGSKVRIFTNSLETNNASINSNGKPSDLLIYSKGNIYFRGDLEKNINALIYSMGDVFIEGHTILTGSVTSKNLRLNTRARINSQNSCINPPVPPVEKNKLIITPQVSYGLTCERIPIDFYVYHDSGKVNTDFVGNLTIKQQDGICWSTTNDGYCFTDTAAIPISGGHIQLYMQSINNGNININANLAEDKTVTATGGPYRFAPYGFRINGLKDIELVAGKPKTVTIEAVASSGAQCTVIKDYQGNAQLTFSNMQGLMPKHLYQPLSINADTLIPNKKLSQNLLFQEGISHLTLKYSDAGSLDFSVFDPKWRPQQCSQRNSSCSDWEQNWSGLQGKSIIKSRPWTFAICPVTFHEDKLRTADGNSDDPNTEDFTAAGKPFDIVAKPLIWQSGDSTSESAMIDVSKQTYCNRPITQNFFATEAPSLNGGVILSEDGLDSPNNGQKGVFSSQPQTDNSQQEFNGLLIADNSWSEVGSLWVKANLNNYLGMKVNPSRRHIGRFYPDHFMMVNGDVRNAHNELSPFTYMGQPFTTSFTIEAQNKDNQPTTNYGLFNEKLKQSMEILARNQVSNAWLTSRLDQSNLSVDWEKNWNNATLSVSSEPLTFKRKNIKTKTTIADGPYDIALGIHALPLEKCPFDGCPTFKADKDHNVWFWKKHLTDAINQRAAEITGLIHSRYGRMALQDAAGDIGKSLTIPLRIEYWNGAEFVTNSDDSASTFDGANYCRQILIQEPAPHMPNNPTTSGAGKVNLGQSLFSQLMANPDGDFKQQIRFWQRLSAFTKPTQIAKTPKIYCKDSASNQPWLSFNWRGLGDEDPSATVTFGVYHGNNRIIYRGEANAKDLSIPYQNYQ
ncbi:H-type lectin domain-containing protein [Photobacterium carnosum]|uniref:H-type lectin domain-containing protein n=1 Tax=Photobacterium carnosum TaxID=2023717 RepID=UPI001E37850F|nr:H-type lectin domain-containing protein [Photobacterium carnosum]MCD9494800.1 hypothetical protein [Photobacterium carnosum]